MLVRDLESATDDDILASWCNRRFHRLGGNENIEVDVLYIAGSPAAVELPNFVELAIARTDPGVRGDTAQGGTKPATLETGAVVQVPLFLSEGDVVKVDTRTGEYLGRVAVAGA